MFMLGIYSDVMELPTLFSNSLGFLSSISNGYTPVLLEPMFQSAAVQELSDCGLKGRVGLKAENSISAEEKP